MRGDGAGTRDPHTTLRRWTGSVATNCSVRDIDVRAQSMRDRSTIAQGASGSPKTVQFACGSSPACHLRHRHER